MAEQIEGIDAGVSASVNKVGVTAEGRIKTDSINESILESAAKEGRSFNVNTGTINLTTGSKSALFYLQNNGDKDLLIPTIGYLMGNSTGGSGDVLPEVIMNPTSGTIVSSAVDVDININKNFGSSKSLAVLAYKGAEGNTLTDGSLAYGSLVAGAARPYVIQTGLIVLPKGSSIAINFTPPSGNTSMDIQVFMAVAEDK